MFVAEVRRWGKGHALVIPKEQVESLGLAPGDRVEAQLERPRVP